MLARVQAKGSDKVLPEVVRLVDQVVNHVAWRGEISFKEAADLLREKLPYTFVLSKGFDKNHYILSYVSESRMVKHKNIRIVTYLGQLCFMNGADQGPSTSIDTLVRLCLGRSAEGCTPLTQFFLYSA